MNSRSDNASGSMGTTSSCGRIPCFFDSGSTSQITTVLVNQQLGKLDSTYMRYRTALQEISAKLECCSMENCKGVPAKTKITLCPSNVEQITKIEISLDGKYLIFGTSKNALYLVDLWKLRKLSPEVAVESEIEDISTESFKIVSKYDNTGCIQDVTKIFGPKSTMRSGCETFRRGIRCLELSPGGDRLMTCGHKSNQMEIINIDKAEKMDDKRETDDVFEQPDEYKVWTNMGSLSAYTANQGIGKITGGTWVSEDSTAHVSAVGTLKVCRVSDTARFKIPAEHQVHFPTHALPVEGGHGGPTFPVNETLSTLVDISKIDLRNEFIVTSTVGEIYVLKTDEKLGITARGVRREGIPRTEFCSTDQRKERLILCQAVDMMTGTVVVGTLAGLTFMDTRLPHLLTHAKLYDVGNPKDVGGRELDQGEPVSIHVIDNVVTAGLYNGFVTFYDMRNRKWVPEEDGNSSSARLTWPMGVQESHVRWNKHNPNNYPLVTLAKRDGVLAVGGGPVFGGTARERTLEGVLTVWE